MHQRLAHELSRLWRGDVLPDPEHSPTQFAQTSVRVLVTRLVPLNLPLPPLRIGSGGLTVHRTSVPEASIDEHDEARLGEDNVHAAPWKAWEGVVDSVAVTPSMQLSAKSHLRPSIAAR